jgi:branched-chain amino acid transport system ATP-binding protein
MSALVEVKGLNKFYGAHQVLKDVNLEVADGEGFAIIGPNGAGKTTLFKAVTGEIAATSGAIRFSGVDVGAMPAHQRIRLGMARTFQVARVFLELTCLENVIVAVETRLKNAGLPTRAGLSWRPLPSTIAEALERLAGLGLEDKRFVEARHLSHGDKKKLELALALTSEPKVLMLDEPTAGMSPAERMQTVEMLQRIRAESKLTLMLTEHDMDVVFGLADRILVLNYGEVIVVGSPEEVRANPTVHEIYLGHEMSDA